MRLNNLTEIKLKLKDLSFNTMKTIRLGNDVQINWYITRFGEPEDFTGKNLTVKLIDKLGNEQVFEYEIEGNRITGIFFGKDQSTNGVYRLLLVENDGEEDMVSLDYIDAFCLSNKMKNQTSNGSDTTSTINTEVEEYESQIDLEQDLFLYAKKTYVNEKIDEVNQRIDNLPILNAYTKEEADARFTTKEEIDEDFYNKQEIDENIYTKDQVDEIIEDLPVMDTYTKAEVDAKIEDVSNGIPTKTSDLTNDSGYTTEQWVENNIYTKDQVDQIIEELPASDTYTKSEIDAKIEDVSDNIPTNTSDLTNDSGYATEEWVKNKHYLVASDIAGKADASNVYTKAQVDQIIEELPASDTYTKSEIDAKIEDVADEIPTKTSDLTNDSGYTTEQWVENKHYLVASDIAGKADASNVYTKDQVDQIIEELPASDTYTKSEIDAKIDDVSDNIPTKTSDLTNDSGFTTEQWVENKHYLVDADIAGKADASTVYTKSQVDSKLESKADVDDIPTKTSDLTNDSGFVSGNDLSDVATSGSYNDLSDKPTIPSLDGYATEEWVENKHYLVSADIAGKADASTVYTKVQVDAKLDGKADKSEIPTKTSELTNDSGFVSDNDLADVAKSGSYNDLTNKPVIPSLDGYATEEWVEGKHYLVSADIDSKADASTVYTKSQVDSKLEGKADKSEIPSKTSELTNDSGFVSGNDLADVATSGSYNDLTDKPTIPSLDGYATEEWVEGKHYLVAADIASKADSSTVYTKVQVDSKLDSKADVDDIPTKTSDLTNDSGFIDTTALATLFDGAAYDSSTKRINFKHGNNILAFIDATAFIKDGMVESVVIEDGYVVITFNTDSGKDAIRIDITDIFDPSNYYDKTAINGLLAGKQNVILDLNQIRLDASAGDIAYGWGNHAQAGYAKDADLANVAKSGSYNDLSDKPTIPSLDGYATEQWVENKHYLVANDVSTFVDASTVYTKVQVDNKLALKADKSEIPTKTSDLTNDSGFVSGNDLADVATSGSYNDLTNKPTIPAAPVQSDWNEDDTSDLAYINNKPTIPTKTSDLTNDSDFITQTLANQSFEAKAWRGTQAEYDALTVIEQNKIYIILPAS